MENESVSSRPADDSGAAYGTASDSDLHDDVRHRAEREKDRAGEAADDVAGATRRAAEDLDEHGDPQLADLVRRAAAQFSSFAESLRNRNTDELLSEARRLARTNPLLFIGGSVAVGFALSRVLQSGESSSVDRGRRGTPPDAGGPVGADPAVARGAGYDEPESHYSATSDDPAAYDPTHYGNSR